MANEEVTKLEAANKQLRDQLSELGSLAGSLAHEIKNPLSVIRMNMDLLAEDLDEVETSRERRTVTKVGVVQSQCSRLENLLDDFLRFARLTHLELTPGSLNHQIEKVLDLYEAQAMESRVEIIRYLDPDLPSMRLDAQTLQAALVNLVKNGLEAMPNGGELTIRTYSTRGGVAVDLIDTGYGMDPKTAMHMFDAFFSTKDGGSGLGLPTTRKIIEAHGGRIDVQSAVGTGTKFTLEFSAFVRLSSEGDANVEAS